MSLPEADRTALASVASIPRDDDGPVFREPWEAQAFAMTVRLHERGIFTWTEWADALGGELAAAGPDDTVENYYVHWLSALEKLTASHGLVSPRELDDRKQAWDRAARATPHGEPIELGRDECQNHDH